MKKKLSYLLLFNFLIIFVSACAPDNPKSNESDYTSENLTVELRADTGNGEVKLDWLMVSGADTYNIYWIADTQGTYSSTNKPTSAKMKTGTKIEGIISAPYTVTGLTNGTKYWFAFSASKEGQLESGLTLAIPSTPINPAPLPAPENVRANVLSSTSVQVIWDDVPAASGYIAYWTTINSDFSWDTENSGKLAADQNSYTFNGLTENYAFLFFLQAVDSDDSSTSGDSSASFSYVAQTTATPPPAAPVLTTATAGSTSATQILLHWTTVTGNGDVTYKLYYGLAKGISKNTGVEVDIGDATQGYMTNMTKGLTYYFVVTAVDDNGESAESNEKSVTPIADPE
jgi:hypothetical protein